MLLVGMVSVVEVPQKPIGYCNKGGDESSKNYPVFELTPDQEKQRTLFQHLEQARRMLEGAKTAHEGVVKALTDLGATCKHEVFRDEPCWDYATRHCVICGK